MTNNFIINLNKTQYINFEISYIIIKKIGLNIKS